MDRTYWTDAIAAMGRQMRLAPKSLAREVLKSGVRVEAVRPAAPRRLIHQLAALDGLTVPLGDVTYTQNNMDPYELYALGAIVQALAPRRVFEIGTFNGASTHLIARCAPEAEIFTLDLTPETAASATVDSEIRNTRSGAVGAMFRGTPEAERITQLYGDSRFFDFAPWRGSVDLVVVDGGHEFEVVASDTRTAGGLLTRSGAIVWDDYMPFWPGVIQAVDASGLDVFQLARTDLAVHFAPECPLR